MAANVETPSARHNAKPPVKMFPARPVVPRVARTVGRSGVCPVTRGASSAPKRQITTSTIAARSRNHTTKPPLLAPEARPGLRGNHSRRELASVTQPPAARSIRPASIDARCMRVCIVAEWSAWLDPTWRASACAGGAQSTPARVLPHADLCAWHRNPGACDGTAIEGSPPARGRC